METIKELNEENILQRLSIGEMFQFRGGKDASCIYNPQESTCWTKQDKCPYMQPANCFCVPYHHNCVSTSE
jgi:hypothetical protein